MGPQKNILEFDFFKAWNEGEIDTKVIFEDIEKAYSFTYTHPGVYVGFSAQLNSQVNRIKDLYGSLCFIPSTQMEVLKNGFLGATLNMGCNIFWYTNMVYKKKEFDFLEDGYTIMEIKMYDPVNTKVPEPT